MAIARKPNTLPYPGVEDELGGLSILGAALTTTTVGRLAPRTECKHSSWREPRSPATPRVEGSGRTVLACPTASRKRPTNQLGTRAGHGRRGHAWPTSLAPSLAPGGLAACHGVHRPPGSKGRADRPARQQEGPHHDRGKRQLRRQPHR